MDYNKGPGYPNQGGYPQGGYPPPYNPTNAGYDQHPQGQPNVVVVGQPQHQHTVIVEKQGVNHVLHFVISLFFWPWVIVWIILCITE